MKIKISTIIVVVIVVLIAVYFAGRISVHPKVDRLSTALKSMQNELSYKDIVVDGLTQKVAQKDALVLTYKEALNAEIIGRDEMRRLHIKELNSKTSLIAELYGKLDSIAHTGVIVYDTLYIKDTLTLVPSIRLPFAFSKVTTYTSLKGEFNREGILSAEIGMKAPLDIYVGLDRKSKAVEVKVTSPNPDLSVVTLQSVQVVRPPLRWWERPLVQRVAAFGVGYIAGKGLR